MDTDKRYPGEHAWYYPDMLSEFRYHDACTERDRIRQEESENAAAAYWGRYQSKLRTACRDAGYERVSSMNMAIKQRDRKTPEEFMAYYEERRAALASVIEPDKQPMFTQYSGNIGVQEVSVTSNTYTATYTRRPSHTESEHSMNLSATAVRVITGFVGQVVDNNTSKIIWQSAPITEADLTEGQQEQVADRPDRAEGFLNNLAVKKAKDKIAEVTQALFADGPVADPEA